MNTTVKIDGSPALFCYSKFPGYPDNSICLKSFVANANNVLSSEDEIDEKYGDRPEMAEKLKFGLELAKYIPEGECWQGDCLFTQRDLKEQEIEGTKYITFHPNKIVYAFSEDNEGYEKVKDAEFGIAFHTIYKAKEDGGKSQSFRVDPERLKNVPDYFYIMSPAINSAKANDKFDTKAIDEKFEELKKAEQVLNSNGDYENLVHNEAFMDYWNTFENANLADKKATNIDEEKFFDDLVDYISEKQTKEFQKKYANLKTVKGKSGAITKWAEAVAELKDILRKNRKVLEGMVKALNLAADIKMLLWAGFKDTNTDYKTFYKSRTKGFFGADMEGIAMSDADGNIVKIVDRSAFSSYNRDPDIMSGWEHPESSNKKLENRQRKNKHLMREEDGGIKLQDLLNDLHPKAAKGFYRYLVAHNQFFGGGVGKECYYDRYELAAEYKSYIKSLIHTRPAKSTDEEEYGCDVGDTMFEAYFGDDPTDLIMVGACTTVGGLYTIWDFIEGGVAEDYVRPDDMRDSMVTWTDRAIFNGYPNKVEERLVKERLGKIFESKSIKPVLEDILWNKFNELLEDDESQKTVVIGWGRMNPPTIGHLKLINKMKDLATDTQCPARLFLSHTVDKKNERKNPLPYDSKIKYATIAFGELVDVVNTEAKTIMFVLHDLYAEGFTKLIYVGGEDRIGGDGDITELITKYNGYPAKENMYYKFDSIVFESAGHRDENSESKEEKASASYVRQLVVDGNWEEFKEMVPFTEDKAEQLYKELQVAMKCEPLEESIQGLDEAEVSEERKLNLKYRNILHKYLINFKEEDSELKANFAIDSGYQNRHPLEAARIRPEITSIMTTEDFINRTGIKDGLEIEGATFTCSSSTGKHGGEMSSNTFESYEVTVEAPEGTFKVYIADVSKYKKIYTPNKVFNIKGSDYEGMTAEIETAAGKEVLKVAGKEIEYRDISEDIKSSLLKTKTGKESKEGGISKNILPALIEAQYTAEIEGEDGNTVVDYLTGRATPSKDNVKSNFVIRTPANKGIVEALSEVPRSVVEKLERSLLVDFAEVYGSVALSAAINKRTKDPNMYVTFPVASNEPLLDYTISNVPTKGTGLGYRISAKTNMGGKPSTTGVIESIVKFLKSKGKSPMAGGKTVLTAYPRGVSLVNWLNDNVSAANIDTHQGFQALENLLLGEKGKGDAKWLEGIKIPDVSSIVEARGSNGLKGSDAVKKAEAVRVAAIEALKEIGISKTIKALNNDTLKAALKAGQVNTAVSSYITKVLATVMIEIINKDEELISQFNALFNLSFGTFVQVYLDEKKSEFYKGSFYFNAVVKSIDGQALTIGKDAPRYEFNMNTGLASKDFRLSNQKLAVTLVH